MMLRIFLLCAALSLLSACDGLDTDSPSSGDGAVPSPSAADPSSEAASPLAPIDDPVSGEAGEMPTTADPSAEPAADPTAEPMTDLSPDVRDDPAVDRPVMRPEPGADAEARPDADADVEAKPDADADAEADPDIEARPDPDAEETLPPDTDVEARPGQDVDPTPVPDTDAETPTEPSGDESPLAEPADLYDRDGYGTVDVLRIDVRTVTEAGTCTIDDQSGCTLADVIADVDPNDDLKVDIPVHVSMADFPEDGRETNAEMRQRGASARLASRKSFRIVLKGSGVRWRGEDKLQINKHPYDPSFIRNKIAFDLMSRIPNLPSTRTQFVNLWIDDGEGPEDYGVFTHDEAANDEFFENRDWDKDGRLYKAEKFLFALQDLDFLALDEDGEPVDEDRFEERLEIQHGKDHRPLLTMIRAVNDKSVPFETTLARYFDEENVLTYVAVNLLLGQPDATTHNFYLYNPAGSERFYYLPWDYDLALSAERELQEGFEEEALARRLFHGFGKITASNFLKALFTSPGFHQKVVAKADELRNTVLSDASISDLAARYSAVVAPVIDAGPDRDQYKPAEAALFDDHVGANHAGLTEGYLPFSPSLSEPRVEDGNVRFSWSDAHDVAGRDLTYDLEIATTPEFRREDRLFFANRIPDEGERPSLEIPVEAIGAGTRYVRLIARVSADPDRIWQIAGNRETIGGERRIGTRAFQIP